MLIPQAAGKRGDFIYLPTAEFCLIALLETDFIPAYSLASKELLYSSLTRTLKMHLLVLSLLGNLKKSHFPPVSDLVEQQK